MLAAILSTSWGWSLDIVLALRTRAIPVHIVATAAIAGCRPVVIADASISLLTTTVEDHS